MPGREQHQLSHTPTERKKNNQQQKKSNKNARGPNGGGIHLSPEPTERTLSTATNSPSKRSNSNYSAVVGAVAAHGTRVFAKERIKYRFSVTFEQQRSKRWRVAVGWFYSEIRFLRWKRVVFTCGSRYLRKTLFLFRKLSIKVLGSDFNKAVQNQCAKKNNLT